MTRRFYWIPYVPVLGVFYPFILKWDDDVCITDSPKHFILSGLVQGVSIGCVIGFLIF